MSSYLWPITSPLPILAGYKLVMFGPCACFTPVYVQNLPCCSCICHDLGAFLHILSLIFDFLWRELLSNSSFSMARSLWRWALLDCGLLFFQPILLPFSAVLHFLLHYFVIPIVVLFDPSLLGFFGPAAYSSLNDSVWSLGFLLRCLRVSVSHFLLGILGPFTFLGHSWPFLIMCSHGFLLTPLGFPSPITLSLILGAHGLVINPLLSLLALLRAYCGPFSLFYITYCPWVCQFSLFRLL